MARAAGVRLPNPDLKAVEILESYAPEVTSSTAQDVARHHHTEVDSLNGYLVRRAEALNVPAPVNRTLHGLVKLLEESL